mmetsp:Transcript_97009/g.269945  ORF Transcript_97009/g.269945 Transcript_97009/m.269945 type:complete len:207 (-) Transcript_97009:764-1384(-)
MPRTRAPVEGAARTTAGRAPAGTSNRCGPGDVASSGEASNNGVPTGSNAHPAPGSAPAPRSAQPGTPSSLTQPSKVSLTAAKRSPLVREPSTGALRAGFSCTYTKSSATSNCCDGSTCTPTFPLEATAASHCGSTFPGPGISKVLTWSCVAERTLWFNDLHHGKVPEACCLVAHAIIASGDNLSLPTLTQSTFSAMNPFVKKSRTS